MLSCLLFLFYDFLGHLTEMKNIGTNHIQLAACQQKPGSNCVSCVVCLPHCFTVRGTCFEHISGEVVF